MVYPAQKLHVTCNRDYLYINVNRKQMLIHTMESSDLLTLLVEQTITSCIELFKLI